MRLSPLLRDVLAGAAAVGALAAIVAVLRALQDLPNPAIAALLLLLIVLGTAMVARLRAAFAVAVLAVASFNYFLLPPFHTFALADPQNWVALAVFFVVASIASQLSAAVRARAREAVERQNELARLFDLSRDVLLLSDSPPAIRTLAGAIARRFDLDYVAIALPCDDDWEVVDAGRLQVALDISQVASTFADAQRTVEFDAYARAYAGHRTIAVDGRAVRLVPLRVGVKPVGVLAAAGRPVETGTLDALGGVVAIGIEHAQLLESRKEAELTRRSEQLKTALLASLGHDLRTPLTAIRLAAANLKAPWLDSAGREEQSDLIGSEAERLTRLFQNILDMARIDAGAVDTERRWVHPSEIIEAAREQVGEPLQQRTLDVRLDEDTPVRVDPRLTATALARVLENAAEYSPQDTAIEVAADVGDDGLLLRVRDHGPGIGAAELPHLFDRFYRGAAAHPRPSGSGMGLAIARGLLAAEQGRIWAESCEEGGARFSMVIPAERRLSPAESTP